jgi:hypothetical protein
MSVLTHEANWYAGWWLILFGFITGAAIGMFFHRPDFMGGYSSFRRRIIRLGHIALAALGMLNLLYSFSPWPVRGTWLASAASACFIIGGVSMPAVCFATGWREHFRLLFFIPVFSLVLAVVFTLLGGKS